MVDVSNSEDRLENPDFLTLKPEKAIKTYKRLCAGDALIRIPGIYPCVRSIPVKNKKTFLFFSLEFKLELELELGWKLE